MKKRTIDYIFTGLGVVLLGTGLFLLKTLASPQGILLVLPYVCIGVGCGVFGQGMGNLIAYKAMKRHPDIQKRFEIDKNDERSIAVSSRAKAKAYDMMTFVFGALMLSFALMGVDMAAVLLLVFAYLFVHGYGIYCQYKYDKEM